MKSAIYTKADQVGLAEIDRPQIEAPDDAIIRVVRTCVCGSDLWSYRNPDIEEGHRNSGHEAIGIVEESVSPLQRLSQETLSSRLSHTVVESVMPVVPVMMAPVIVILAITGQMGCKQSTSVSILPIGPLSKFQGNRLIIQKLCLNPS